VPVSDRHGMECISAVGRVAEPWPALVRIDHKGKSTHNNQTLSLPRCSLLREDISVLSSTKYRSLDIKPQAAIKATMQRCHGLHFSSSAQCHEALDGKSQSDTCDRPSIHTHVIPSKPSNKPCPCLRILTFCNFLPFVVVWQGSPWSGCIATD
jgi:hypothetical protein